MAAVPHWALIQLTHRRSVPHRTLAPWEQQLKDFSHRSHGQMCAGREMRCVCVQDNKSCRGHLGKPECCFFFACCGGQKWEKHRWERTVQTKGQLFHWSSQTDFHYFRSRSLRLCLPPVDPQHSAALPLVWALRSRVPQSRSRPVLQLTAHTPSRGPDTATPAPQRTAPSPGAAPRPRPAARPAIPRRSAQGRAAACFRLWPPFFGCGAMEDADYFEGGAAEWGNEADGGAVSAEGAGWPGGGHEAAGQAEPRCGPGGSEGRRKEGNGSEVGWVGASCVTACFWGTGRVPRCCVWAKTACLWK